MILYYNSDRNNAKNTCYPFSLNIASCEDLQKIVAFDHVCAAYSEYRRKRDNFICADCSMFDVDNTDSDEPSEWIWPEDVGKAFPNVPFYVSYSRNHLRIKDGKSPRPKFHVYFPDVKFTNVSEYEIHKEKVCNYFSAFDRNAKDVARFFIGVEQPKIEFFDGSTLLFDFMKKVPTEDRSQSTNASDVIPQGQRNSTLHKYALRVLTRYGDASDTAFKLYIEESSKCLPLLSDKEVQAIWDSVLKYYNDRIKNAVDYIPPEQFNNGSVKPQEFTDVWQADRFAWTFHKRVRYSPATNYLFFNGKFWEESDLKVRSLVQSLVVRQLDEARLQLKKAQRNEDEATVHSDENKKADAKAAIKQAERYRKCALAYQHTLRIGAILKEAQPMLEVDIKRLDSDGFMLNTPDGTVDLRTKEIKMHAPEDFCTKITNKSPSKEGTEIFERFLSVITCGDKSLEEYLQNIAGMVAVGKVFCENLIIAYGCGRNGKSTFFNLLSHVLGSYSGSISAEILTANCRKNKSPEYAELRGKRLAIAAELEDGMRLDTSIVKKLCSTDPICAEKKYKDPFSFVPTHTIILYTNHLPSVSALDTGTWRRLIVIPFNAAISPNNDIKNYADFLYENAGGAVMSWIVEGAYKFIASGYNIEQPEVVKQAISIYREKNDWISNYISERCEVSNAFIQPSGALYQDYREFCNSIGEFARNNKTFNEALEEKGFSGRRNNQGSFIRGLRLRPKVNTLDFSKISVQQVMGSDGEIQDSPEMDIEF